VRDVKHGWLARSSPPMLPLNLNRQDLNGDRASDRSKKRSRLDPPCVCVYVRVCVSRVLVLDRKDTSTIALEFTRVSKILRAREHPSFSPVSFFLFLSFLPFFPPFFFPPVLPELEKCATAKVRRFSKSQGRNGFVAWIRSQKSGADLTRHLDAPRKYLEERILFEFRGIHISIHPI
jgi:hypothetical protein